MTQALVGKESIPLTSIALGPQLTFVGSLAVLLSEVIAFALELAGVTLEELKAGLLEAGKDRLKFGLLAVTILELSLKSV